jgi:hypothetical protein
LIGHGYVAVSSLEPNLLFTYTCGLVFFGEASFNFLFFFLFIFIFIAMPSLEDGEFLGQTLEHFFLDG